MGNRYAGMESIHELCGKRPGHARMDHRDGGRERQCEPGEPTAIEFGCDGQPGTYTDTLAYSTAVLHGNYDYVTDGVANWASPDHVLNNSMYYDAKPGVGTWWCDETPWPPIGPDVLNLTNDIPAKRKHDGASCTVTAPPPPASLHQETASSTQHSIELINPRPIRSVALK